MGNSQEKVASRRRRAGDRNLEMKIAGPGGQMHRSEKGGRKEKRAEKEKKR